MLVNLPADFEKSNLDSGFGKPALPQHGTNEV